MYKYEKIICSVLSFIMLLSICGCSGTKESTTGNRSDSETETRKGKIYTTTLATVPERTVEYAAFNGKIYSVGSTGDTKEHPGPENTLYCYKIR